MKSLSLKSGIRVFIAVSINTEIALHLYKPGDFNTIGKLEKIGTVG